MSKNVTVGIDIGTYRVKVVVTEQLKPSTAPRIIATGGAESRGLRHGYIINSSDAIRSIRQAISQAEKEAGISIDRAFISIGGIGLESTTSQGSAIISRADSEITELDIEKAHESAENNIPPALSLNRKIIHSIPIQYMIDGKPVLGNPLGMRGTKLIVKILFISCLENHINDLIEAVEEAGVEVIDVSASPIAASFVTLTKTQKIAGCVLANIGAETVSIVVFENNIPISLEVFPIGTTDITHDIALNLKIPLEEAEQIKLEGHFSSAVQKNLEEIIDTRLKDMLDLIEVHLKKIGRDGLLPAGIIITGGGSGIGSVSDLAKSVLRLPSQRANLNFGGRDVFKDSTSAVAYGLCILGLTSSGKTEGIKFGGAFFKSIKNRFLLLIKQILP